jgi:multidrug transporter EmrE-like cation transporter
MYSCSGLLGKFANSYRFLSPEFLSFYAASLAMLVIYASLWQSVLKKFSLTIAFSNKGVVVLWGMLWGALVFGEKISLGKIIAAMLIITGIIILGRADG